MYAGEVLGLIEAVAGAVAGVAAAARWARGAARGAGRGAGGGSAGGGGSATPPGGAGAGGINKGFNPFKGKSPSDIDRMFRSKGYKPSGPDPINGRGGYVNPKTKRSYYIDPGKTYKKTGPESPHVDVNRPRGYKGPLPKRKFPL